MTKPTKPVPDHVERNKKLVSLADELTRMPINDCTADDQGVGFVIEVGGTRLNATVTRRAAASPTSPRALRRDSTKSK